MVAEFIVVVSEWWVVELVAARGGQPAVIGAISTISSVARKGVFA